MSKENKTKKVQTSFVSAEEAEPQGQPVGESAPANTEVPTGKETIPAVIPKLGELLQAIVANQETIIKQNEAIVAELVKANNKPTTSYQYKPRYPQGGSSGNGYGQGYRKPWTPNQQNYPQGQPTGGFSTKPVSQVTGTSVQSTGGLNTKKLQLEQALAPFGDGVVIGETNMAFEVKVTRKDRDLWMNVAKTIGDRTPFMGKWTPAGANSAFVVMKP